MRKFTLPFLLALIFAAMLTAPALAQPQAAAMAMPAGTASPRDWDKLAPSGELLPSAVKADNAILMDANTGKILFEKNADTKRYPASITKIMTCLLALDSGKSLSDIVTVGTLPRLPSDATNIKLKKDEQMTLGDMLYGLMLESGNDAANAIAMYLGEGSIDKFVEMMNAKAQELGMTGTHYANTNGLHDSDHYTTAHDMALLAAAAIKNPDFIKITSTSKYTIGPTNKHPDGDIWNNTNKLISPDSPFGYVYATGIKTGFTNEAEYTLVSSAHKDNMNLVAVVLHSAKSDDRWPDCVTMFEYGLKNYESIDLVELLQSRKLPTEIKNASTSDEQNGTLDLTLVPKAQKQYITDKKDAIEALKNGSTSIEPVMNITKDTAPIKKDETVGTVTFNYNDVTLEFDAIASRDVAEMPTTAPSPSASLAASANATPDPAATAGIANTPGSTKTGTTSGGGLGRVLIWAGVVLLALLAAMLVIRIVNTTRRNKKYRQYNYRQGGTRLRR